MPFPPQGPNDRRLPPVSEAPVLDAYAATGPASGPPPFPLTRRKTQAEAALGQPEAPLPPPPPPPILRSATAPWPVPPSARTPLAGAANTAQMSEFPEASTPFASAVDLEPDDALESDSDRPTFVSPWWRRFSAPSRPVVVGALVAAVSAGLGWTAGAKPWASHRTHSVAAAKAGAKHAPAAAKAAPARSTPTNAHANRRVAVNAKAKPAAAPAPPSGPSSPRP